MGVRSILIVGGYGIVGSRIAAELASDCHDEVIVAGRNLVRAEAAAATIAHGVRARQIDVTLPSSIAAALDGVAAVMSCIDQPGRHLLHASIERGLAYTDITPHLTELGRGVAYERIDAAARESGARLVLGTGIVPGISSVMVRALADTLGGAEEIETALLLSANDVTGPASFEYFLRELSIPFEVHVDGIDRPAHAFTHPRLVDFPAPVGKRPAYLFPFSDQVLYPRTMGARTAISRLSIEPTRLTKVLALMVRTGAVRVLSVEALRHALVQRHKTDAPADDTRFALRVDVAHSGQARYATLLGHTQANAAAAAAAFVLRSLLDGDVAKPGAWMPEQVISPAAFFAHLAAHGMNVELAAPSARR